ncbi:hypothetical protein [Streptomyces rishiriensis]|uniref:hypothetical protein n=1 Tax=Streptomyces rishiriensis TaxID=68264 RepID=UPI0037D1ABA3
MTLTARRLTPYVSVRRPWLEVDPQAETVRWNGRRALPTPAARDAPGPHLARRILGPGKAQPPPT